ncbi:hypothetical protein R1sor_024274 [Riccia sorocarpa]|uniref:Uncharacterized protein n=1 Tax=Riccia sorocarpa TaxID=122646 RepID=A0ABD3GQ26_9MARC
MRYSVYSEEELEFLVLVLVIFQLALQLVLQFLADEENLQTTAYDLMDSDEEPESNEMLQSPECAVVACHALLDQSLDEADRWWIKERNLSWFDYYLWVAYEENRWVRSLRMPKELFLWVVNRLRCSIRKQDTDLGLLIQWR